MRMIDADEMKDELKDMDFVLTKHNLEDWIDEQPTVDAEPVRHGKWKHTDKHLWKRDKDGQIDTWAWDSEFHNGVFCEVCGESICIHCHPNFENDICSCGHYICSECGEHRQDKENYCPRCGAKMDAGDGE